MKVDDAGHKPSNPQPEGAQDTQAGPGQARPEHGRAGQGVGQDALVHA